MKCMAALCAAFLCAHLLITCFPVHGEEKIYDNMIRLHVLAQSDTEEDQTRKLRVRDAVLAYLDTHLPKSDSYEDALAAITDHLEGIRACAWSVVGESCDVHVELGRETYPVRQYDAFTLPAGEYTSLRILLGEGEGQNWWCVLFPRLCTARAAEDTFYEDFIAAGFTPEQYRLIKNESGPRYKIRFRLLEILSEWMGMEY